MLGGVVGNPPHLPTGKGPCTGLGRPVPGAASILAEGPPPGPPTCTGPQETWVQVLVQAPAGWCWLGQVIFHLGASVFSSVAGPQED